MTLFVKPVARALLCLALLLSVLVASEPHTFDVYRLIQYDLGSSRLGSRSTQLDLLATVDEGSSESLHRRVVVLRMDDVTDGQIERLIDVNRVGGLLLLTSGNDTDSKMQGVLQYLFNRAINVPVYFAPIDDKLASIYSSINDLVSSPVKTGDNFQLVATISEPRAIHAISLTNFQGWLSGLSSNSDDSVPTLALIAHYDSFAVVPGMSVGGGSSVIALLELAHMFSRLYAQDDTRGKYNILFMLASGGKLNFAGTRSWAKNVDSGLLESIDFALCLDSLLAGDGSSLHLHSSRVADDEKVLLPTRVCQHPSFMGTCTLGDVIEGILKFSVRLGSCFVIPH